MKNGYFSYSQIRTYNSCPRQYYMGYVDENGKRGLPNDAMQEGSELHKLIEDGLREGDTSVCPPQSKWFVEKYFMDSEHFIEFPFEIKFAQAPLRGKIDLLAINGQEAFIIDWKKFRLPEEDDQLAVYAYAIAQQFNVKYISCWFVSIQGKGYRRVDYERSDLEDLRKSIQSNIDRIVTDENYDLMPGQHCKKCPFVEKCAANHAYEIPVIKTIEDAKLAVKGALRAEALYKRLKDNASDFMLSEGINEIIVGEDRIYFSPSFALRFGKYKAEKKKKD